MAQEGTLAPVVVALTDATAPLQTLTAACQQQVAEAELATQPMVDLVDLAEAEAMPVTDIATAAAQLAAKVTMAVKMAQDGAEAVAAVQDNKASLDQVVQLAAAD